MSRRQRRPICCSLACDLPKLGPAPTVRLVTTQAPACSDEARNAPADKDLRLLAQMTAPRDAVLARHPLRPCNARLPQARTLRATSAERHLAHP